MRSIIFFFVLLQSAASMACSDLIRKYEFECRMQDRFQIIEKKYASQNLNPRVIKGFNLQRLHGVAFYELHKNELLIKPFGSLDTNKEWRYWHNGQRYLKALNSVYLNLSDLLKLHQALILDRFYYELDADSDSLRTLSAIAQPIQKISCEDRLLDLETTDLMFDFDLLSDEDLPLLEMKIAHQCPGTNYYSGEIIFYKGASINYEMTMWLNDFNDMIKRYEYETAPLSPSPIDYLADMKRRFMSLRPFKADNEEVVNALIEYAITRLNLPPMFLVDDRAAYLQSSKNYRSAFHQKSSDVVSFFDSCLSLTDQSVLPRECAPIDFK